MNIELRTTTLFFWSTVYYKVSRNKAHGRLCSYLITQHGMNTVHLCKNATTGGLGVRTTNLIIDPQLLHLCVRVQFMSSKVKTH